MSTDDSDDTHRRCRVCNENKMVPEEELPNHLYENHGDEPEAVEREYDGREFQAVFDELEARGWPPERAETDRGETTSGKWYVLGVGGCGNNLLDAIHLRRERPRRVERPGGAPAGQGSPTEMWKAALKGSEMLNVDSGDLSDTYSAHELGERQPSSFADTRTIDPESSSEGSGANPVEARNWIQDDLGETGDLSFTTLYSDDFNRSDIQDAQAILLLHGTERGVGTGATPHLARRLADNAIGDQEEKPVYAATILPERSNFSPDHNAQFVRNGLLGPAWMATNADVIMPFQNSKLRPPVGPDRINWPPAKKCDGARYSTKNEAFVQFMELFSMSSLPGEATTKLGISGGNKDVTDIHKRARQKQSNSPIDDGLATILAPAMRRYHRPLQHEEFNEERLQNLLLDTCLSGRLVEFDPATAWGGTFLFVVPRDIREEVARVVHADHEPFLHPGVLDARDGDQNPSPGVDPDVIGSDIVDGLYLCATFWNPVLEHYQRMYDIRRDSFGPDEMLDGNWDEINQFRNLQGRDALRSDRGRQL